MNYGVHEQRFFILLTDITRFLERAKAGFISDVAARNAYIVYHVNVPLSAYSLTESCYRDYQYSH